MSRFRGFHPHVFWRIPISVRFLEATKETVEMERKLDLLGEEIRRYTRN